MKYLHWYLVNQILLDCGNPIILSLCLIGDKIAKRQQKGSKHQHCWPSATERISKLGDLCKCWFQLQKKHIKSVLFAEWPWTTPSESRQSYLFLPCTLLLASWANHLHEQLVRLIHWHYTMARNLLQGVYDIFLGISLRGTFKFYVRLGTQRASLLS